MYVKKYRHHCVREMESNRRRNTSCHSIFFIGFILCSVMFFSRMHAQSSHKSELPWDRESGIDLGTALWSVDALNVDTIMAAGDGGLATKTTDRGVLWISRLQADSSSNILLGISYADSVVVTAVGYNGTIVRSTDGGRHWTNQMTRPGLTLFGVSFTDANIGTVVGDSGTILRTTDGGATWMRQDSAKSYMLLGVSFADVTHGLAVGGGGRIMKTTDGGVNWSMQSSTVSNYLYGVSYVDPNTATVVGTQGTILRTIDGGSTWTPQTDTTSTYFFAVSFTDVNNGMIVGEGGRISYTTDGGGSWNKRFSGRTGRGLYAVAYFDTSHWYAVGGGGTIVRKGDSSSVIVTGLPDERREQLPSEFELKQNYPNPFNPTTNFEFRIANFEFVQLKVYDLLGREVATIANGEFPPGTYTRVWNAAAMPSGIYFYELEASNASTGKKWAQTKKLLLMK